VLSIAARALARSLVSLLATARVKFLATSGAQYQTFSSQRLGASLHANKVWIANQK